VGRPPKRFRIDGSNPIPARMRTKELGSGVVMNPVYVPENALVNVPVGVPVPVTVASPVSPAKAPVPPVNMSTVVLSLPVAVVLPIPEKVPNRVPPARTSMNVPPVMNVVRLVKVRVPVFVVVKAPNTLSIPEPVKLESKTAGLEVGVRVVFPVSVPDTGVVSAWAETARPAIITRADKAAASERIIGEPPTRTPNHPDIFTRGYANRFGRNCNENVRWSGQYIYATLGVK